MSREEKEISVHNQKIINLTEVHINQLAQTLRTLTKKCSLNQYKHFVTKSHSLLSALQSVFIDQNFSQVYSNVKTLMMNFQIVFLHLVDRLEQKGKPTSFSQMQKSSTIDRQSLLSATIAESTHSKQKSTFESSSSNYLRHLKAKRMGGINLFNQTYRRGVQEAEDAKGKLRNPKKQTMRQDSNDLLNEMDETAMQLRLQSDQIDSFLALRREKQAMFNHVSYSGQLQEIAHFFKETQDQALEFLNTSKTATSTAENVQEFNILMEQLKQQKQLQSATVISKVNDVIKYLNQKNQTIQVVLADEYEKLRKIRQQMNKKRIDNATQTTHNFADEIKLLKQQLTQQKQRYETLESFRKGEVHYQDQYYQILRNFKMVEVQSKKYKKQLETKIQYVEDLQKMIRSNIYHRTQKPVRSNKKLQDQPNNESEAQINDDEGQLKQGKSKTLIPGEHIMTYKKRKSSQMSFIRDLVRSRGSMNFAVQQIGRDRDSKFMNRGQKKSMFLNQTFGYQRHRNVPAHEQCSDNQSQLEHSNQGSVVTIKNSPEQSAQIIQNIGDQQSFDNQRRQSILKRMAGEQPDNNKSKSKPTPNESIRQSNQSNEGKQRSRTPQSGRERSKTPKSRKHIKMEESSTGLYKKQYKNSKIGEESCEVEKRYRKIKTQFPQQRILEQEEDQYYGQEQSEYCDKDSQACSLADGSCSGTKRRIYNRQNTYFNSQKSAGSMKINIIDINKQSVEESFSVPRKQHNGSILKSKRHIKKKSDEQKEFLPDSKQKKTKKKTVKMTNQLSRGQQLQENSIINGETIRNPASTSKSLLPYSNKERFITTQYGITVYPTHNPTKPELHMGSLNHHKMTDQEIQDEFARLYDTINKGFTLGSCQQQKMIHFHSQHHPSKKVSLDRQARPTAIDRSKIKGNKLRLKKGKLQKLPGLSFQDSCLDTREDALQFERLKQLWRLKYGNIQEEKEQIIRKHLHSCGEYCVHLQRYLSMFKKIAQQDRTTLKVHIENLNKYQAIKQNESDQLKISKGKLKKTVPERLIFKDIHQMSLPSLHK